jgi:hypothetical protein
MSNSDEYRANAQECQWMADKSTTYTDRVAWLDMRAHWLYMIRQEELSPPLANH